MQNLFILCVGFNQDVVQRVVDFEIELLNMPIHLKIILPSGRFEDEKSPLLACLKTCMHELSDIQT